MSQINRIVVIGIFVILLALIATTAFGNLSQEMEIKYADIVMSSITGLVGFLARGYVEKKPEKQGEVTSNE